MKAMTVHAPFGELITYGVKTIETRSRPMSHRGPIAIHNAKKTLTGGIGGNWCCTVIDEEWLKGPELWLDESPSASMKVYPGHVVGSARVTACLPMVGCWEGRADSIDDETTDVLWLEGNKDSVIGLVAKVNGTDTDWTEQLPFGDYQPGRWAIMLEHPAPTTVRCPWCMGDGNDPNTDGVAESPGSCPGCGGACICVPHRAKGQQAMPWNWLPHG